MIAAFAAGFQPKPLAFQLADFGGRSGYWRLVFAKMQEDALKPPEKEVEKPAVEVVVQKKAPAKKSKLVGRVVRQEPVVRERWVLPPAFGGGTIFDKLGSLSSLDFSPVKIQTQKLVEGVIAAETVRVRRRQRRRMEELLLLMAV